MNPVEPRGGIEQFMSCCCLLPEFHEQAAESVDACEAFGFRLCAPERVAVAEYDWPVRGGFECAVDPAPVGEVLAPEDPAHDVDAVLFPVCAARRGGGGDVPDGVCG